MTIASFCRDELLAHGPLTLDELATRAVAAGVTRAANPASTVRQAIQYGELDLGDGRWTTPLLLLEGRCLTTTSLTAHQEDPEAVDTTDLDLSLLRLAARDRPIPIVGGGALALAEYGATWEVSGSIPEPDPGHLLCLRVVGGELAVTSLRTRDTESPSTQRFTRALNGAARRSPNGRTRSTDQALVDLLLSDEEHLREPAPPLSWCCETLREKVATRKARRREQQLERWRPVAYVDERGIVTLRLTTKQAEVLQQVAACTEEALGSRWLDGPWGAGPDHLRLLR